VVRDAHEHGRHFRYGDDEAQIACGRLAQGNDVDALAVDLNLELIDLIVVIEHFASDVAVAFAERVHRTFKRLFGLAPEQEDAIAQ
jgi:hypothetical protein